MVERGGRGCGRWWGVVWFVAGGVMGMGWGAGVWGVVGVVGDGRMKGGAWGRGWWGEGAGVAGSGRAADICTRRHSDTKHFRNAIEFRMAFREND